jgi:hypothetical protein
VITAGAPHLEQRRKQPQLDSRPLKLEHVLLFWASAGLGGAFSRWRLGCAALATQAADGEAFVHKTELRKAHMLVQSAMTQQAQQQAAWAAKLDRGASAATDARVAQLEAELRAARQQLTRQSSLQHSSQRPTPLQHNRRW